MKRAAKIVPGASPPSTQPQRVWRCPTKGCPFRERGGKAPHWNPCPECRQPVGHLVPAGR